MALRGRRPIVALGALLGALGYVIAGSIGAASLALVGPALLREYAQAGADQAAIAVAFGLLTEVVFRAIWQLLDGILIAVWMMGVALSVWPDQPAFARLSVSLGTLFLVSATFDAVGLGLARDATLGLIFGLWFIWDAWLAVLLWRRSAPFGAFGDDGGPALASRPFENERSVADG